MKNMKVSRKLTTGFLAITALSVLLAIMGVFTSSTINDNYRYLVEEPIERQAYLKEIQFQLTMVRYRTANFVMEVNNPDIIRNTLTPQYETAYAALNSALESYIQNTNADTRRDADILKQNIANANNLGNLVSQYKQACDTTREQALAGLADTATETLRNAIPMVNAINAQLDDMLAPAIELTTTTTEDMGKTAATFTMIQIVMAVVCVILSLALAYYISRLISRPLLKLKSVMDQIGSTGSLTFTDAMRREMEAAAQVKDEIGQSILASVKTIQHFEQANSVLEQVAGGDLTVDFKLISNQDTIGLSIGKMIKNLNRMFEEINASSNQVAIGSKQIAEGAQSLAQGATEQAASVEQLSASVSEIAGQTKRNADIAREAAGLSRSIRQNAEKGSAQMGQLMQAVKEINDASGSISKVIKVIDDIAFQTNILALNAAVEAARAGAHGKGFAVVAEEVRSLAAKSAEAARDTGGLIESSISKADLGLSFATETSASLKEIVEGIIHSAEIVDQIARSSDEQAGAIGQINTGIDQVAQVVQQTSATAQQSAAASQQMSGQSAMLTQLISQFKLKGGTSGPDFALGVTGASSAFGAERPAAFPAAGGDYGKY